MAAHWIVVTNRSTTTTTPICFAINIFTEIFIVHGIFQKVPPFRISFQQSFLFLTLSINIRLKGDCCKYHKHREVYQIARLASLHSTRSIHSDIPIDTNGMWNENASRRLTRCPRTSFYHDQ